MNDDYCGKSEGVIARDAPFSGGRNRRAAIRLPVLVMETEAVQSDNTGGG